MIFNYINNGDLRGAFKTREDFIGMLVILFILNMKL